MKKGFYYLVASFIFAFVGVISVNAKEITLAEIEAAKATPGTPINGVTCSSDNHGQYCLFEAGEYTLNDNVEIGEDYINLKFKGTSTINLNGKTLQGGIIADNNSVTITGNGTLKNSAISTGSNGVLTVNGGTYLAPLQAENGSSIIVNSATVTPSGSDAIYVFDNASLTVNGGTFTSEYSGIMAESVNWENPSKPQSIIINGGTFTGTIGAVLDATSVTLSGGTFISTGNATMIGANEPASIVIPSTNTNIFNTILKEGSSYSEEIVTGSQGDFVYIKNSSITISSENESKNTTKEETKEETEESETTEPTEYKYVEGAGQEYKAGDDDTASFRIDADYSLFKEGGKVYVDNTLVAEKDYESKEGSTIITFTKDFMSSLNAGSHTLKVVFNNEGVATTSFTVKAKETAAANTTEDTTKKSLNPKTGDNIVMYATLLIVSVIGLGALFITKKKFEM